MLKKPEENRQKYRKTIKNFKTAKKQTKIWKIDKNVKKPGKTVKNFEK